MTSRRLGDRFFTQLQLESLEDDACEFPIEETTAVLPCVQSWDSCTRLHRYIKENDLKVVDFGFNAGYLAVTFETVSQAVAVKLAFSD